MKKLNTIICSFKEINRLDKNIIPSSFIISLIEASAPFVNIIFTSKIIDMLSDSKNIKEVFIYILFATIINFIVLFLSKYIGDIQFVSRTIMNHNEIKHITHKLFDIEFSKTEDSKFKELIHKYTEAQDRVSSAFLKFTFLIRDFVNGFITLIISIVILFPLFKIGLTKTGNTFFEKPIFLIVLIVSIALLSVFVLFIAISMNKNQFEAADKYATLNKIFYYFRDMLLNYNTGKQIRLYKEEKLIEKIATEKLLNEGEKILKNTSFKSAKSSSIVAIVGSILGFGVYLFIGVKGFFGLFSVGSLVLYCGSFMQIVRGIIKLVSTFGKTEEIIPMINYYFNILNTKDDMHYGNKIIDLSRPISIEFKDVDFKYPNSDNYALKNINLTIMQGEHVAIVGRNGSGKTTFIKLLCRLYDVSDGEILINDINIKEYTKDSIISLYSVVFQDFSVFSTTVADNIAAETDYDETKLFESLEKAGIKDRVLKMNYKEKTYLYKDLNADGVEISGGEAQKLVLARALYKNAPIVVLDEPTAAMDPISESEMYENFNTFVNDKTAIYISHRLSSCAFCDKIAVFENAQLMELGTHSDLIKLDGIYARLWKTQAKYYINDMQTDTIMNNSV